MIYTYLSLDKRFIIRHNGNQFDIVATSFTHLYNGCVIDTDIGLRAEPGSYLMVGQGVPQEDFFVIPNLVTHRNRFRLLVQVGVFSETNRALYANEILATIIEIPALNMGNSELVYSDSDEWLEEFAQKH